MARSWVITTLLLLSLAAIGRTQYFDLLQGFQQLFQQYQPKLTQNNNDVTRHTTVRQPNKQKIDERRSNEQRKKKPTFNQFDYIFSTTTKPSRKITKSQTKVVTNNRNSNKDLDFNTDFMQTYQEITTKSNRNKPTTKTTISNNIGAYTTTTEKAFNVNLNNRDNRLKTRPENVDSQKKEYTYDNNNNFNNRGTVDSNFNNRPTANNNRNNNNDYYSSTNSNLNNQNYNNKGITNNDNRPNNNQGVNNRPEGNRNVNVANLNDRRISETLNPRSGDTNNRGIDNNDNIRNNNQGSIIRGNTNTKTGTNNTKFNRQVHNFGFVTQNPSFNRPEVRPPVAQNFPPITNRPISDNIFFPNSGEYTEPQEPELLIGPDEEGMTSLQKRRYVDLSETMCEWYKALNVRKLVALPPSLIPSPSPVEFNVTSCNPFTNPLVIGGKVVDIKEYPHMSLVGWKKLGIAGYSWKCGGSLISDQYILTAGHCTYQDKDANVISGLPHVVQLGSTYLDDPGAQVVKITSVIRHPKYKRRRAYHDVALIKMMKRISFSEVIKPACIGVAPPVGNNIVATGWGRTELGGDHSKELRSVSLPIWDINECRAVWETSLRLPQGPTSDSHVCAGDRTGEKDTCQGDSGGPAQIQDGCVWRIVAVTSIGKSCGAPHTPALYAVIPRAFVAAQVFGEEVDYGGRGNTNRRGEEFYRRR